MKYRARLSGPLADRIDLHVNVPPVALAKLSQRCTGEGSAAIRERVQLHFSAGAFHRVLRVARTIADLEHSTTIETTHVAEALGYRPRVAEHHGGSNCGP